MTRKLAHWNLYPTLLPDALLTVIQPPRWGVNDEACDRSENAKGWQSAFAPHFNPFRETEALRIVALGATHWSPAGCPLRLISSTETDGRFEYVDPVNNYGYGVGTIAEFSLDDVSEIHQCCSDGCDSLDASPCWLPGSDFQSDPDEWYCDKHIHAAGYCRGCGTFWAGIESFDFGNGYCDNCRSEFEHDSDDWDDDSDSMDFGWYDDAGYPYNPYAGWGDLDRAYSNELPECPSVRILRNPNVLAAFEDAIPF